MLGVPWAAVGGAPAPRHPPTPRDAIERPQAEGPQVPFLLQARCLLKENDVGVSLHHKRNQQRQLSPHAPTVHQEEAQFPTCYLRSTGQVPWDTLKGVRGHKAPRLMGCEG